VGDYYEEYKNVRKGSLGYNELKKHNPRLGIGCRKLLTQRKQAKLQWLQHPSEMSEDSMNIVTFNAWKDKEVKCDQEN
jgi:hypothetical protein